MDVKELENEIEVLKAMVARQQNIIMAMMGIEASLNKRLDVLESLAVTVSQVARESSNRLQKHLDALDKAMMLPEPQPPAGKVPQKGIEVA